MKPKTVGRVSGGSSGPQYAQNMCYGLPVGLPILTRDGEIQVEQLSAGDHVVTRNGGMTEVTGVTATTQSTRAVKFTAGCFGTKGPAADIVLPFDQPILVHDWRARALFGQSQAITAAGQLVDGEFITDIGPRRLLLFRLSFDKPRVIYAHGLELGTNGEVMLPRRAVA